MIIKNRVPIFEKGKVLDKEMLDEIKNIGIDYINSLYFLRVDGVVYGIEPRIENNQVIINPGMIKYKGNYYKILEKLVIDIPLEDGIYICELRKISEVKNDRFAELEFEFKLREEKDEKLGFEIFRIARREGANLKEPKFFYGLDREYNTLNLIHLEVATVDGKNLCEKLIKLYAKDLLENKELDDCERILALYLLNSSHNREFMLGYLNLDLSSTNLDIYKALEKRYISLKDKRDREIEKVVEKRKLLVE